MLPHLIYMFKREVSKGALSVFFRRRGQVSYEVGMGSFTQLQSTQVGIYYVAFCQISNPHRLDVGFASLFFPIKKAPLSLF